MKKIFFIMFLCLPIGAFAATITVGAWTLSINESNGNVTITKNQVTLLNANQGVFKIGDTSYNTSSMTYKKYEQETVSDGFGDGQKITIITDNDKVRALHEYYLYENKDYFLTRLNVTKSSTLTSNYIAPINTTGAVAFLPTSDNRDLFVPYDNDEWVSYNSYAFGGTVTSYEVKPLYNATSNAGMVIGFIEHTTWKSAIRTTTDNANNVTEMVAYSGAADSWTRDVYGVAHGSISGTKIASALIMVGYYADWRDGMEQYGDLCAIVHPKLPWNSGKPFVWNSWGVLQTSISFTNANESAEWMHDNLPDYVNDSVMYVDLDSYWDNLTSNNLKKFATYCHQRGQKAGIYWTPFVDWGNNPDRQVEGAAQYKYKDIWLYHNGNCLKRTGAAACDPTHPGTRARINHYINNFIKWGFDFVKLDFMDHGALEADSHYDPNVTTGVQAYCQGMAYLDSVANGQLYLNLSIAPLFPAHFAHGRRIACDAYASIDNTKYTLNSTTFGWWLDHVYQYNDADNIVFKGQSEAVNKCRLLSGLVTGMMCIGDDYSSSGDATAKERAKALLTNPLLEAARQTKAFRPVTTPTGTDCAEQYYTWVQDTLYIAVFNFKGSRVRFTMDYNQFGLNQAINYDVTELFANKTYDLTPTWQYTMDRLTPILLKIHPHLNPSDLEAVKDTPKVTKQLINNQIIITRNNKQWNLLGVSLH